MVSRVLYVLTPVRVTVGYAAALVAVATTLLILGPRVQEIVIRHVSTNLHNLVRGHVGTLVGSAFVTSTGPIYIWLPGLMCLLALAELWWRSGRLVLTFALGHVGATLIVALGLATAVRFGWTPISVARTSDVGISYGAAAVLGALTAAIPARWRPAWVGWWLTVSVLVVAVGRDFTDAGHVVALVLGMLVSTRFRSAARWTVARYVLAAVGVSFGYLMLVNVGPTFLIAPPVGVVGAAMAHHVAQRWRSQRARRSHTIATVRPPAPEPVPPG
ncbi:rhomboid-like protein [Mycobacterium sp.]|uniref:rhomboid-like protein n=1 Tax=Mycobacterium sp. TaxID=1785 RepID=UPI002D2903C2|nr:rhomboid-like protein [Mycobacterium sp.]HZA09892.1 rhomboid-like protein [Mycobacterium sp.]